MYSKTLSSKVKIRTSELPPEALRRYGFADESPELDLSRATGHRRQDQHLKDGITNALYRLELDNVKPSLDVLAQTGFRKSHYLRKHSPGEDEILLTSGATSYRSRVKRPVRPYSYIEPRLLLHQRSTQSPGRNDFEVKLSPDRSVEFRERARSVRPASTASWYYTEPTDYSFLQGVYPTHLRPVWEPEGGRVLSDYRDTVATSPPSLASSHSHGRWSVYGPSAPSWTRSQSTPPGRRERASWSSQAVRQPIVGNRLTRTKNREYSVGVKLAESHTDLDNFSRLLDKNFGGENSLPWRTSYSVYPFYAHYNYLVPRTQTEYRLYSPRTKVTRPPEKRSAAYSTSDYVPYSGTYYYSSYMPSSYSYSDYLSEPWYLPYYSRGGYYSGGSYVSPLVGRYTARYLY